MICAFEASIMLSGLRRLCGQSPIGPSGVADHSRARTRAPISPPPCSQSEPDVGAIATLTGRTRALRRLGKRAGRAVVRDLARAPQETTGIVPEIMLEVFDAVAHAVVRAHLLGQHEIDCDVLGHLLEGTVAFLPRPDDCERRCHGTSHAYTSVRRSSTSASSE